jgi:cyclophilin family peptidyl-prolyl cis-trans isomerase
MASRHLKKHRSRRLRQGRSPGCEPLESRRLLAVDVAAPIADQAFANEVAAPLSIPLAEAFRDTAVTGTVVRFDTITPTGSQSFFAELFDTAGEGRVRTTPKTVANFLDYVNGGAYDGSIIHRSVQNFVLQGGGFNESGGVVDAVESRPPVENEPGNTNVRGTLAMAKLGGDPDSATNQWFVNLADNSENLDNQNGGFTAFGRVVGDGMTLVDTLAAVPRYQFNSPFTELPLWNYDVAVAPTTENFVRFESVSALSAADRFVYDVSSSTAAVAANVVDGQLVLTPTGAAGSSAKVTVRASSPFDATDFIEQTFEVVVLGAAGPRPTIDLNGDGLLDGLWRDAASGIVVGTLYDASGTMTGTRILGGDADWTIGAPGDFNGDGVTDFVWLQASSGLGVMRIFNADGSVRSADVIGGSTEWGVEASGDFDGDGRTDIIWRHHASGVVVMWLMNGAASKQQTLIGGDTSWRLVATDSRFDVNADGNTDLIWRDAVTGTHIVKRMAGASELSATVLGGSPDWEITATGDFDGDGYSDVLWRQASTGSVVQWRLVDAVLQQSAWVGGSLDWSVVATEDADGDGRNDIIWRQASTGVNVARLVDGSLQGASVILGGDQNWSVLRRPGRQVG